MASGVERSRSVSSTRNRNAPPTCRAKSQLKIAARMFPMCTLPVGEGAKRTRICSAMSKPFRAQYTKNPPAASRGAGGSPTDASAHAPRETGQARCRRACRRSPRRVPGKAVPALPGRDLRGDGPGHGLRQEGRRAWTAPPQGGKSGCRRRGRCAILLARRGRAAAFCALRGKVACLNLRTSSTSNVSSKVRRCGAPLFRIRGGLLRAKTDARKDGASFRGPCAESGRARACVWGAQAEGASPLSRPGSLRPSVGAGRRNNAT